VRRGIVLAVSVGVLTLVGVGLVASGVLAAGSSNGKGRSHPATLGAGAQPGNAALIRAANQAAKRLRQGMVSGRHVAVPPKVVAPSTAPPAIAMPQSCYVASALEKCSETPCIQYAAPSAQPAVQVPLPVGPAVGTGRAATRCHNHPAQPDRVGTVTVSPSGSAPSSLTLRGGADASAGSAH
jgi:hypothetical protein